MAKTERQKAEIKLAAIRTAGKRDLEETEEARKADHVAKLRALRLAKEAADKEAGEKEKAGARKPPRLPQAHRRQS
jgi:hypothetical protein